MPDRFPTGYYQAHEILVCPNGDKVRSDEEGLFCWLDGSRVSYPIAPGEGIRINRVPTVPTSVNEDEEDGEGEEDLEENSAPAIDAVPTAKKPAAKKPATKKPATKKPAAKKPAAQPSESPAGVSSNAN